jgi:hypothetical protein
MASTAATITPNTTGVSTGLTVVNGDITTYRSGGTTGVIYLSNSGTRYLYWDASNYNLNGAGLIVGGAVTASNFSGAGTSLTGTASSLSIGGNAATATTLIGDQTNWASYRSSAVANMLSWKNYGNGHIIFDASASTSPTGAAVNNTNPGVNWASTYPTLMGWNGSSTYGVRVDVCRYADSSGSISGYNNPTTAATANTIAYRDSGGDLYARYFVGSYQNSTDDINTGAITYIMAKFGDNYHRSATAAKVATFISGQTMNISGSSTSCTGNAATATSATSATNASNVTHNSGRTDATAYPVVWASGSPSPMYSCAAVTITSSTGTLTATALTETSSIRYKENVIDLHNSLDKVLSMRGVAYNRKGSSETEIGLIAEEVNEVVPEIINFTEDGQPDSVSYGRVTALLIESVKEQQKQIERQQKQIDDLIKLLNNK